MALESGINTRIYEFEMDVGMKLHELEGDIDGLKSDVRDILTQMDLEKTLDENDVSSPGDHGMKGTVQ